VTALLRNRGITTPLIIEQHLHGAFGICYNTANIEDVIEVSDKLYKHGIGGVFPTLVTDSVENIKKQIEIIKEASTKLPKQSAKILGIHLEGLFINPKKKGIHDSNLFLPLTVEEYKKFEDDFIKIITLAPELDEGLIEYLRNKAIKIQAGHCIGNNLSNINGVTHTFNAMDTTMPHKIGEGSTLLSALTKDDLYCEVIADGVHVSDDALNLLFKAKPQDRILLISDALPITNSSLREIVFAGRQICYDGQKATGNDGTIAGSTTLLDGIIKRLGIQGIFNPQWINNTYKYHEIQPFGKIVWDADWNIKEIIS